MKYNLKINEPTSQKFEFKSCLLKQALGALASCLISLCSGLTVGISAVMLPQLREDKSIQYNPDHDSWIASIVSLSMIIGSLACGPVLDTYGRRIAHIVLGIPFTVGWIIIACANSTSTILIGRFVTGLASGANKAVALVYIGEIADPKIRASALFLPGINTYVGILISHVVCYYVTWKLSCVICILPAVISSMIFFFLKESPLWLIAKGRTEEGIKAFRWFRGTKEASEVELRAALQRQTEKPKMTAKEMLKVTYSMGFVKPMLIIIVVMISMQMSGANILRCYSQDIFRNTFSGKVNPFTMTLTMDCIRVVLPVLLCILERFFPRKLTFLVCCFGVPVFAIGLVTCLMIGYKDYIWVPVSCSIVYVSFSSILIAIGWTFVPELLPGAARGFGSGMGSAFGNLMLFGILKTTPDIMSAYGVSALYSICGLSTLICGLILCFVLPDTNGKTLQSIEDLYTKKENEKCYSKPS